MDPSYGSATNQIHLNLTKTKTDPECVDYELGVRCETGCETRLVTCLNECSPTDTRFCYTF